MSWKTNALTSCFSDAVTESAAGCIALRLSRALQETGGDSGAGNGFTYIVEDLDGEALRIIRSNVTVH